MCKSIAKSTCGGEGACQQTSIDTAHFGRLHRPERSARVATTSFTFCSSAELIA
jgi:hypothetical protein